MRKVNVARGAKLAKGFQMARVAMGKVARDDENGRCPLHSQGGQGYKSG